MNIYEVNGRERWDYLRKNYKNHPKWIARKKVRWILNSLIILGPIIGFLLTFEDAKFNIENIDYSLLLLGISTMSILAWIPGMAYGKILGETCQVGINQREDEVLYISDESIKDIYHWTKSVLSHSYKGQEIKLKDIKRVVYNKLYKRIDIYGPARLVYCRDTRDQEETYEKDPSEDPFIRICLYFYGNENILETIKEKSPVEMEVIDCPEWH